MTPTHQRMLKLFSDGLPHTRRELHACLDDELSALATIQYHISTLRKLLPAGEAIDCVFVNRRFCYRHVRLLASAVDGKT